MRPPKTCPIREGGCGDSSSGGATLSYNSERQHDLPLQEMPDKPCGSGTANGNLRHAVAGLRQRGKLCDHPRLRLLCLGIQSLGLACLAAGLDHCVHCNPLHTRSSRVWACTPVQVPRMRRKVLVVGFHRRLWIMRQGRRLPALSGFRELAGDAGHRPYMRAMMASPNSLVPSLVAPSIWRSRS